MRSLVAVCLGAALILTASATRAEGGKVHRIVFELTSESEEQWQGVLNNIENVQKAFGKENTEIEVVSHGKGLWGF